MEIFAKDNKLKAALEDEAVCKRRFGAAMSKKLTARLAGLRAATSLAAFWPPNSGPERCHELKADLAGTFSIDVEQPYRLLFRPIEDAPAQDRSNELERWGSMTAIEVVGIEDTHG